MDDEPFIGEIMAFAGNYAPQGWALCDGQLLSTTTYEALFSLLGTIYGGDGVNTFALPDLRGRVPIHVGQGPNLSNRVLGQSGGANAVALTSGQVPVHNHLLRGTTAAPVPNDNVGNLSTAPIYRADDGSALTALAPQMVEATPPGPATAHENRQPFLTLNFIIALIGVYPSRN